MQQFEEVDSALASRAGKPGKQIIANLRHKAILAYMARTGVIDRNGATNFQSGDQYRILLRMKGFFIRAE